MIAVAVDPANQAEVKTLLESRAYHKMSPDAMAGGDDDDDEPSAAPAAKSPSSNKDRLVGSGKGKVYDVFMWMPSMEDMMAAGIDMSGGSAEEAADGEEEETWNGKPEIEYHVSDDEEDDEDTDA